MASRLFQKLIIDLVEMRKYACQNNEYALILTGVDRYLNYAMTLLIKQIVVEILAS